MSTTHVAEITVDAVETVVKGTPTYSTGVSAKFVPLTQKWGFKMYLDRNEAYFTYFMQRLLHSFGCCPAVGQQMPPMQVDDETYYGYLVEIPMIPKYYHQETFPQSWDVQDREFYSRPYMQTMRALQNEIQHVLGEPMNDLHPANIGFLNDRMVAIDVGQGMTQHDRCDIEVIAEKLRDETLWAGSILEYLIWGTPDEVHQFTK